MAGGGPSLERKKLWKEKAPERKNSVKRDIPGERWIGVRGKDSRQGGGMGKERVPYWRGYMD